MFLFHHGVRTSVMIVSDFETSSGDEFLAVLKNIAQILMHVCGTSLCHIYFASFILMQIP